MPGAPQFFFRVTGSILEELLLVQVSYSNGADEKAEAANLGSGAHRIMSARLVSGLRKGGIM